MNHGGKRAGGGRTVNPLRPAMVGSLGRSQGDFRRYDGN